MNADRIARWYRWLEYASFGSSLRKRREAFLFELGNPQKVLVLGDGDGRFLQVFRALYPQAQIEAVDNSPRMIELAQARVGPSVNFHLSDARDFDFDTYDLAVAHFFFDCFEDQELAALLARINTKQWLVSEFQNTKWSWPILKGLYLFFRWTTSLETRSLPNHQAVLKKLGYRLESRQQAQAGLLVSELWSR